jgi:predicted DCC family thiol-disulfide oxidoreductase YuxK
MEATETNSETNIVLFDGFCNLCSAAVQFIIKRDKKKKFQFASLQSEFGKNVLIEYALPTTNFNSLVLVQKGKVYTQSTGALKIARLLSAPWPICYVAMILPKFIRDSVYNWIAKNRYKWFGRKEVCTISIAEENRIID